MATPDRIADQFLDTPDAAREALTPDVVAVLVARSEQLSLGNATDALRLAESAESAATHISHPLSLANALTVKGIALAQLRRFRDALNSYQAAQTLFTQLDQPLDQANVQSRSLFLHYVLGEQPRAISLAQETRTTCFAVGAAANRILARVEFSVGVMHKQSGNYKEALAAYETARALLIQLDDLTEVTRIDINRANIYQEMDRFDLAQQLYQQAQQQTPAEQRELRGHIESNLGLLAHRQGQYQQAISWFESAENSLANNPVLSATASLHRAIGYYQLGLIPETITLAEQAAQTFAQNTVQRDWALALQTVGKAQARLRALSEASAALTQARQLYAEQNAPQDVAETELELARLALAQGDMEQAYALTSNILQSIDADQLPRLAAQCHIVRAQARSIPTEDIESALLIAMKFQLQDVTALGFWQQAIALSKHDAARAWRSFQTALHIIEAMRAPIWLDEFQLGFMEEHLAVYQSAVAHLVRHGHSTTLLAALLDALQSAPLPREQPATAMSEDLSALRQQWHWFNSKLEQQYDQATHDNLQTIERQIATASRHHLLQSISSAEQQSRGVDEESAEKWLSSLQQTLSTSTAILHYFVDQNHCYAIIITPAAVTKIALGMANRVNAVLRGWRHHLGDVGLICNHPDSATQLAQRYLQALFTQLFTPLQSSLPADCKQLKIILPAEWHDLPIAALHDGNSYIAQQFCVSYLSSPSALLRPATPTQRSQKALLLGNSCDGLLPNSVAETQQVTAALGDHWDTTILVEEQAVWRAVQPQLASATLIHCATHALFRPDNPLFSWLQLADHRMTVTELYEQPLRNRPIVTLSACETGRGTARGGGLAGMARAWLAAGASGLIVTSWRVEDKATATLITNFYSQIATGAPTAAALQHAQQLQSDLHPFFWAGFVFLAG